MRLAMVVGAGALLLVACQGDRVGAGNDGGSGNQNEVLIDAGTPGADAAEIWGAPESVVLDICEWPLFKLPLERPTSFPWGIDLADGKVAYSKQITQPLWLPTQVYVFDLETCVETRLTSGADGDLLEMWGDVVYFRDTSATSDDGEHSVPEIYRYDLSSWTTERVVDGPGVFNLWAANEHNVLYDRLVDDGVSLNLMSVDDADEQVLVPATESFAYPSMDARGVSFCRWNEILYYDLDTGETRLVERTLDASPLFSWIWEDYLVWFGIKSPEYVLVLHHLPSGTENVIGHSSGAQIHRNLVMYTPWLTDPAGRYVALYDIDTGATRRITREPGELAAVLHAPHLLVATDYGGWQADYYVADLHALGVLDETGHLIEGDGVIDASSL